MVIPAYTREKDIYSILRINTFNKENGLSDVITGIVPLAKIMRHAKETTELAAKGKLSEIGHGKKFEIVKNTLAALTKWS